MDKEAAAGRDWRIIDERAAAADLHAAAAGALNTRPVVRTARFSRAERPALVLGSHQAVDAWDAGAIAAAGLDLARRSSGGSAVLVGPGRVMWVDLVIPVGDPLWDDDVGRAAWWVGDLWASVVDGSEVWRGAMRANAWSPTVCFAGLGPGEVTLGGRKVVGISQRRTPRGALFQTAALLEWRPEDYTSLLRAIPGDPAVLASSAVGLGAAAEERLESDLTARLMT